MNDCCLFVVFSLKFLMALIFLNITALLYMIVSVQ